MVNALTYKDDKEEDVAYEDVDLYLCEEDDKDGNMKCKKEDAAPGYFVNSGNGEKGTAPYIECTSEVCKPIGVEGTSCAAKAEEQAITTGQLYYDGEDKAYKLCIFDTVDKSVEFSKETAGKYFVSIASGLFGITEQSGHYIVVDVDASGNIKVVKGKFYYFIIENLIIFVNILLIYIFNLK